MKNRVSTEDFRKSLGLSRPAFSKKFGVPRRTLEGWEAKSSCPSYVLQAFKQIVDLEEQVAELEDAENLERRVIALENKINKVGQL